MPKERVDIIQNNDIGFVLSKAQYEINGCKGKDWVSFVQVAFGHGVLGADVDDGGISISRHLPAPLLREINNQKD